MSNANEEMVNAETHASNCSVSMVNTTPNLQNPRKLQRHKTLNTRIYSLRKKNVFGNIDYFSVKHSNVNALRSLLCKPLSVNLTRLTDSDLKLHTEPPKITNIRQRSKKQQTCKFNSHGKKKGKDGGKKAKSSNDYNEMHKEIHESKVSKHVTTNVCKNVNQKDCEDTDENVSENISNEVSAVSMVQRSSNNTQSKKDLLKNIKQPTITLSRIDEVINKLAQTFAKVITNKQSNTVVQEPVKQQLTVIQTEEIVPISQKLAINTNRDDYSENSEIDSSISDTIESENLQDEQKIDDSSEHDSDSDLLQSTWKSKRKCRVIYDSNDETDSDESHKETLEQTKRIKLSTPEKGSITVEKHNVSDEEQTKSFPKIDVPNKVLELSNNESVEMNVQNEETITEGEKDVEDEDRNVKNEEVDLGEDKLDVEIDIDEEEIDVEVDIEEEEIDVESIEVNDKQEEENVNNKVVNEKYNLGAVKNTFQESTKCTKESCASNLLASEDCLKVTNTSCTSENMEVQQQVFKPCMSDNELIQKHNLCKEARVLLIDLPHIKSSFNNKYSAVEIEQLTQRYINLLFNSNLLSRDNSVAQSNFSRINELRSNLQPDESESPAVELKDSSKSTCASDVIKDKKNDTDYQHCTLTMENGYIEIKFKKIDSNVEQVTVPIPAEKSTQNSEYSNTIENSRTNDSSLSNCAKPSEQTDMPQFISLSSIADSLNNKKSLTPEKKSSSLKKQLNDTAVENHQTDGKQLTTNSASLNSPTKHKKVVERKEISKGKDLSSSYKCIVCDLCFDDYFILQQHLSKHAKETTQVPLSPSKSTNLIKNVTVLKGMHVKVVAPPISKSPESQHSNSKGNTLQAVSPSTRVTHKQDSPQKKLTPAKHRKHKVLKSSNDTNECNICSHEFPSRADLAAHIFLHTESELQEAYKIAKQNMKKVTGDAKEGKKVVKTDTKTAKNDTNESSKNVSKSDKICSKTLTDQKQDNLSLQVSSKNINENRMTSSKPSAEHKEDKQSSVDSESRISEQVNGIHSPKTVKSVSVEKHNPKNNEKSFIVTKVGKVKSYKAVPNKKLFAICECHNKADAKFNCLKIEIVLLCHTCKVLFRTMECFESHYRLSKYTACNQNRFDNGRSPNLFCATCGMVFSSVQDVRQHLEMHVRFKQNCTMDFRCNICKVIFVGVGPLFYIHWSKHTKNSFWVGNEQSFPKSSIINRELKKENQSCKPGEFDLNKCIENYTFVGEHICQSCKLVFIDDHHFKMHKQSCEEGNSAKSQDVQSVVEERQFKIRLICSLCHDIFSEELDLYTHMKNKHKFATEPQFVCVSLTDVERTFICNICMEVTENIDQFNKHWLKHYVSQPCFICTDCKQKCNTLDSFLEHVKEHDCRIKGTVFCWVNYQDVQFVCKLCHVGFQDQKWLSEHDLIHNLNKQKKNKNTNEATNQESSTLNPETNNVCNTVKTTESTIEKMLEKFVKIEQNQDDEVTKEKTVECSMSSTNLDKEKLINILEGNEEEDSENELVIDLTEHPESYNESVTKDRPNEKHLVLPSTLNANASSTSENLLLKSGSPQRKHTLGTASKVKAISSSDAVSSDNTGTPTSSQNICLQETQNSYIPTNIHDSQSTSTENKEPLDKNDSVKRKHGFLRVKTLAELVGNTNPLHVCKVCQRSFKSVEELTQHLLAHTAQKQSKESLQKKNPITQQPSSSTVQKVIICKPTRVTVKPLTKVGKAVPILKSINSPATNAEVLVAKSHPAVPSSQSSVSAYHKNLPPCMVVREVSRPHTITQINTGTPMHVAVSSSKAQNLQVTSAAINSRNVTHLITTSAKALNTDNFGNNKTAPKNVIYHGYYPKHSLTKNPSDMSNATTSNINRSNINQNIKQTQYTTQNKAKVNPSRIYYQYSNPNANYSGNVPRPMQSSQLRPTQSVTANPSSAIYYKNSPNGGMSIVINQTTPALPSLSKMGIPQQQEPQSQMYQPVYSNQVMSVDPYTQQSQNIVDYSGSDELYHVGTNDYDTPVGQNITTCEVTLQPSAEFVCPYCPNSISFINRDLFELHIRVSHNFTCEICSMTFYNIEELSIHRMRHELI